MAGSLSLESVASSRGLGMELAVWGLRCRLSLLDLWRRSIFPFALGFPPRLSSLSALPHQNLVYSS